MSSIGVECPGEPALYRLCRLGQQSLPWLISVFLHLGVVVVLSFLVIVMSRPKPELVVGMDVSGGVLVQSTGPKLRVDADRHKKFSPSAAASARWINWDPAAAHASENDLDWSTSKRISLDGPGRQHADGDDLWGDVPKGPGGAGPALTPPGGDLTRVVYLLDASGSMLDTLDLVKRRLYMELGNLRFGKSRTGAARSDGQGQYFNVIFFRDDSQACWPKLMPATSVNKRQALRWADSVLARGETDPAAALTAAFRQNPEQIVVLSDGEFGPEVLQAAGELQRGRDFPVRIITIAYGKGLDGGNLRKLAESSGGKFLRIGDK